MARSRYGFFKAAGKKMIDKKKDTIGSVSYISSARPWSIFQQESQTCKEERDWMNYGDLEFTTVATVLLLYCVCLSA